MVEPINLPELKENPLASDCQGITAITLERITGLVLAGGRGARFGHADKGLIMLDGRPMVEHVIARMRAQVGAIVISANRHLADYEAFGFPVVCDDYDEHLGPLSGIASGLRAATTDYVVTVPCDTPLVHETLVARLRWALQQNNADVAVAHDGCRLQPTFLLLKRTLLTDLTSFLNAGGRKIQDWLARHRAAMAHFVDCTDAFSNINDAREHARIEAHLQQRHRVSGF